MSPGQGSEAAAGPGIVTEGDAPLLLALSEPVEVSTSCAYRRLSEGLADCFPWGLGNHQAHRPLDRPPSGDLGPDLDEEGLRAGPHLEDAGEYCTAKCDHDAAPHP
jgi:hypothetical protein